MKIDVSRLIGAVTREISTRQHEGRTAHVLVASRTYDTNLEDLWDALTSAKRIPRWFLPISGELRLGGRYQFQGNAGGSITRCEPPRHLSVTWEMRGEVSWVEVTLSQDRKGGAHLRLEHIAHVPEEMWGQFGPGAVGVGWEGGLLGLERHFAKDGAFDPKQGMIWMASDEGKAFLRLSSEAWGEASIAAGTDAAAARAAAERTTAFYTGDGHAAEHG